MLPQATQRPASDTTPPSDAELLDILYEILADDTGEDHGVSVETIEAFLHQHAREPQAAGTIADFFAKHELSTKPTDYGRDPALQSVPSGVHAGFLPLPHEGSAPAQASLPAMLDEATPARSSVPAPVAIPVRAERSPWLMPTLVTLALMVGLVGAVSAFVALNEQELERDLSLSRLQLRATSEAVDALRLEAQSLHRELDAQRASERQLGEQLTALQEAERVRAEREEAQAQKQRRGRWRRPAPNELAAAPAP